MCTLVFLHRHLELAFSYTQGPAPTAVTLDCRPSREKRRLSRSVSNALHESVSPELCSFEMLQ